MQRQDGIAPAISHEFVSFSQESLECVQHGSFLGIQPWKLSYVFGPAVTQWTRQGQCT